MFPEPSWQIFRTERSSLGLALCLAQAPNKLLWAVKGELRSFSTWAAALPLQHAHRTHATQSKGADYTRGPALTYLDVHTKLGQRITKYTDGWFLVSQICPLCGLNNKFHVKNILNCEALCKYGDGNNSGQIDRCHNRLRDSCLQTQNITSSGHSWVPGTLLKVLSRVWSLVSVHIC